MSAKSPLRLAVHHSTKEVLQALVALRSTSDEHHPLLAKHHPIGIMQGMRPIHPVLWQPQLWQTRWSKESSRGWKIYPSQKIVLVDENQTETTSKTLRQQVNLAALPQESVVHWKKWHHPHFDLLSGWPPRRKFELESVDFLCFPATALNWMVLQDQAQAQLLHLQEVSWEECRRPSLHWKEKIILLSLSSTVQDKTRDD